MAKWEEYLEEGHFEKILTVGGILAVAIGSSYVIKSYLDILRIKVLRKELKNKKELSSLVKSKGSDENWILDADGLKKKKL